MVESEEGYLLFLMNSAKDRLGQTPELHIWVKDVLC